MCEEEATAGRGFLWEQNTCPVSSLCCHRGHFLWDVTLYPHIPLQTHSATSQHAIFPITCSSTQQMTNVQQTSMS